MEWTDDGIVLGTRRHGEANAIVEVMTRDHGRHLGLVRGGGGTRLRPVLQPGNTVRVVWRARLDEHLGNYVGRAAAPARRLAACGVACGLWRHASRRAVPAVAGARSASGGARSSAAMLEHLDDPQTAAAGDGAFRTADAGRAGLRPRPRKLRRDRRRGRSRLRVAEVRPRGVASRRRALAGPVVPAAGVSVGRGHAVARTTSPTGLR